MGVAYQDRWVKGRVFGAGSRECESRYELIRPFVAQFTRPVTVWDLGANLGYFGNRLAEEFGAVSVMVEPRPQLVDVCKANALPSTLVLQRRLTGLDLAELAQSEHADIVLALSFLHRVPDWPKMLKSVLNLGEHIFLELPARNEITVKHFEVVEALSNAVEALDPVLVGTTSIPQSSTIRRPLYYLHRPKPYMPRSCAYIYRMRKKHEYFTRPHTVTSSFREKRITYQDGESRPFVPGMNLWNWAVMDGVYPPRTRVENAVRHAWASLDRQHGDFRPWNLILQGSRVVPIDYSHRQSIAETKAPERALEWLWHPERAYRV